MVDKQIGFSDKRLVGVFIGPVNVNVDSPKLPPGARALGPATSHVKALEQAIDYLRSERVIADADGTAR